MSSSSRKITSEFVSNEKCASDLRLRYINRGKFHFEGEVKWWYLKFPSSGTILFLNFQFVTKGRILQFPKFVGMAAAAIWIAGTIRISEQLFELIIQNAL